MLAKKCIGVLLGWGRCPPAMTDHLSWAATNTFSLGATNTLHPTLFFPSCNLTISPPPPLSLFHHLLICANTFQHHLLHLLCIAFTTWFNSSEPEKNKSTQGVFLIPASPITSRFDHHTRRLDPTLDRAHWHQCWGKDLQVLSLGSDEPDHELVIGYNCPGLTALISQRAFRRLQLQLNLKWPTGQNLGTAKAQNWSLYVPGQAHKSEKAR